MIVVGRDAAAIPAAARGRGGWEAGAGGSLLQRTEEEVRTSKEQSRVVLLLPTYALRTAKAASRSTPPLQRYYDGHYSTLRLLPAGGFP